MNSISVQILRTLRKGYTGINSQYSIFERNTQLVGLKDYANDMIFEALAGSKPCMIARLGATELTCIANYIGVARGRYAGDVKDFIRGAAPPWWWSPQVLSQMQLFSGFFPPTQAKAQQFCELMLRDMEQVDILGSWLRSEILVADQLVRAKKVVLEDLEPFFANRPWTRALEGKTVLVVHPFAKTIEQQFARRAELFEDGLLPPFELKTIKAVQSLAGEQTEFGDWFAALKHMQDEIDRTDFDICIIGAGAYGFPLAAHVKRMGRKAFHLGGVTQLLFGIRGRRWNDYTSYPYVNLYNEHWVGPSADERPARASAVEGACYW